MLDLVFIPIYAFFLWSVGRLFARSHSSVDLVDTGDCIVRLLRRLANLPGLEWRQLRAIYLPSLVKWGLLGLALMLTGVLLTSINPKPGLFIADKEIAQDGLPVVKGGLIVAAVALGPVDWIIAFIAIGARNLRLPVAIVHVIGLLGPHFSIAGISEKYVENFCRGALGGRERDCTRRSKTRAQGIKRGMRFPPGVLPTRDCQPWPRRAAFTPAKRSGVLAPTPHTYP